MDEMLTFAEASLLPLRDCDWNEGDVPLDGRGVSFAWLYDFVARIDKQAGRMWEKYYHQQKASVHFDHVLWPDEPGYPHANFTTREFVDKLVKPLTLPLHAPLYARVPPPHRGAPSLFVSHTWSSYVVRNGHGSLDMMLDHDRDSFVWIDFACYNQHLVKHKSIAGDMDGIISSISSIAFVLTTAPFFTRSWCLWELACAHRSSVSTHVYDQIDRIKYKYRSSEGSALPPDFSSITDLEATEKADQETILDLLVSTFGSVAAADGYIRNVLSQHRKKR